MILGIAVLPACERAREIEAESVHVHLAHPVDQRVHQEPGHQGVVAVHRVAAAGVVPVAAAVGEIQMVDDLVGQPLEADGRSALAALRGVVEDHVQDHPDAGPMQGLDHVAKLVAGTRGVPGEVRVRGEEAVGAVAPVILESQVCGFGGDVLGVEGHDRHQLHMGDAEVLEIGDLFDQGSVGSRVGDPGGWVAGEAGQVHLVDHRLVERRMEPVVTLPVVVVPDHPGAHGGAQVVAGPAGTLPVPKPVAHGDRPGVQQDLAAIHTAAALAGVAAPMGPPVVIDPVRESQDQ